MNLKKTLTFIDKNLLFAYSLFLLLFIPLWPKWPLFDILPGYNVRVRLDDFFVLGAALIYLIYILRGKIKLKKIVLTKPILIYLAVGLASTLSAIFITRTVYWDSYQIGKIFLHYFRRIQYFSLFFIFYSSIYHRKQIRIFIYTLVAAILGTSIYGVGQKYWYWPAYSTMNREFSKGIRLYLMEGSRVLSTFAGHYDFAAYISLTLILIVSLAILLKKPIEKIIFTIIALLQFWMLNLTVSRTSFISLLAGITVTFIYLSFKKAKTWLFPRYSAVMIFSAVIMFSGPLAERFSQVIDLKQIASQIESQIRPQPPSDGLALNDLESFDDQLARVASKSDRPPMPADVTYAPPIEERVATISADNEATYTVIARDRTFSDNALKYGLSLGIRLDTLWPMAWKGFKTNPLLGSGYSTLLKLDVEDRTTAESTDNDYLRLLGEVGLLGFIAYFYIIYILTKTIIKSYFKTDKNFTIGLYASAIGIIASYMANALWIDVWESSKVAYTFWSLMGIVLGLIKINHKSVAKTKNEIK